MIEGEAHFRGPVVRVLEAMSEPTASQSWALTRINEGTQAIAYAVRSQDGNPVWERYRTLVVKLYRPNPRLDSGMLRARPGAVFDLKAVQGQSEALSQLHTAIDGYSAEGWKISVPEPLYTCESPLALVMTMVPGRDLTFWLNAADNVAEVLQVASHGVITAMQRCWSLGRHHGDFHFDNVLYDLRPDHGARKLSLVDAGTPEGCSICNRTDRHWHPSVLDLAHMLADAEAPVVKTLRNPFATSRDQLRRGTFMECLLRAFLGTIASTDEKKFMLEEIRACAEAHAENYFNKSRFIRASWYKLKRHFVFQHINAIVNRLKAELGLLAA